MWYKFLKSFCPVLLQYRYRYPLKPFLQSLAFLISKFLYLFHENFDEYFVRFFYQKHYVMIRLYSLHICIILHFSIRINYSIVTTYTVKRVSNKLLLARLQKNYPVSGQGPLYCVFDKGSFKPLFTSHRLFGHCTA